MLGIKQNDRKLVVVILAMTFTFILALVTKLTAEFSTVISICVPAFVAGNAFEHHTEAQKNVSAHQ